RCVLMTKDNSLLTKNETYPQALSHQIFGYISEAADTLAVDTFAIGGFVRDYFLDRPTQDIDIVTVGNGIELAKAVAQLLPKKPKVKVFKNFGTAMLKAFDVEVEFVGARKESYAKNSRNPEVT